MARLYSVTLGLSRGMENQIFNELWHAESEAEASGLAINNLMPLWPGYSVNGIPVASDITEVVRDWVRLNPI